jgi:hypothetical protein
VNMQHGYIRKDWPDEAIYVGDGKTTHAPV